MLGYHMPTDETEVHNVQEYCVDKDVESIYVFLQQSAPTNYKQFI